MDSDDDSCPIETSSLSGTMSNPESSDSDSYSGASTIIHVSPKVPCIPLQGLTAASVEEKCQAFLETSTSPDTLTPVGPDPSGSVSKKKNKRKRRKERKEREAQKKEPEKEKRKNTSPGRGLRKIPFPDIRRRIISFPAPVKSLPKT